ncbi:hypothetical protein DPMN_127354 [Dreissena polymorpha]|uniref:Uncharacterized protein n=1 Tax=Dreissena polymorpha TaxID=45954 RepID=A0A9D4GZ30_DREPO|nr:hypothetical protein DPMN_127354 [Dreissena polymorpha]
MSLQDVRYTDNCLAVQDTKPATKRPPHGVPCNPGIQQSDGNFLSATPTITPNPMHRATWPSTTPPGLPLHPQYDAARESPRETARTQNTRHITTTPLAALSAGTKTNPDPSPQATHRDPVHQT